MRPVELLVGVDGGGPGEVVHAESTRARHVGRSNRIAEDELERRPELVHVVGRDEVAVLQVGDELGRSAPVGHDHGRSGTPALEHDDAERLDSTRHRQHGCRPHRALHRVGLEAADEVDAVGDAELAGQAFELRTLGAVAVAALRMRALTRDSVGLSSGDRQRNIAGRVRLYKQVGGDVMVIDDIVTTGATASESVRVLQTAGARVVAVLALANA